MMIFLVLSIFIVSSFSAPNFVILFGDDWGYGDLGLNRGLNITPNLDKLVSRGVRFTDGHAMSVCTPSRASLLTGRLGLRTGTVVNFQQSSWEGLPRTEITVAELLKSAGYSTKMIGKWHLGHNALFHPSYRGFDETFDVSYSVDMGCVDVPNENLPPEAPCPYDPSLPYASVVSPALPLYKSTSNCSGHNCNLDIVEQPANLTSLSRRYADEAIDFITRKKDSSFLLYMAFSHVHVPLAHESQFENSSVLNSFFGDTLMEMDHTAGRIISALDALGLMSNTVVFLAGDNGPWKVKCDLSGSAGPFIGKYASAFLGGGSTAKMSTWEGGHRVPYAITWDGVISPGVSDAVVSTLDFFPTIASLARVPLPSDRVYDGFDLSPVLFKQSNSVRQWLFHPDTITGNITAVRYLNYKAYFQTYQAEGCNSSASPVFFHDPPLVFDLSVDQEEAYPLTSPPKGLIETLYKGYSDMVLNISTTFKSFTNYSTGGAAAYGCCNASHVECRCTQ
jgi:arylsulfatase G